MSVGSDFANSKSQSKRSSQTTHLRRSISNDDQSISPITHSLLRTALSSEVPALRIRSAVFRLVQDERILLVLRVGSGPRTRLLPRFDLFQLRHDSPVGHASICDSHAGPRQSARQRAMAEPVVHNFVSAVVLPLRAGHVAEHHVPCQFGRFHQPISAAERNVNR